MTDSEIKECHEAWKICEMSDLSSEHLKNERLRLYHKWFVKLIDHARQVKREVWNAGL